MQQVTLRPGDYVATKGMTEDQYYWVVKAFERAGCFDRYDNANKRPRLGFLEWYCYDLCATDSVERSGRQLTIEQVLNATNAGGKENDMQNWKPKEGKPAQSLVGKCEVLAIDDERGKSAVRWTDGNLGVVNTHLLKPPMTEEDRAVEEMMRIYHANDSVNVRDGMRDIYRAGYRKQPQPTEDMTDPANWRAGDWLLCKRDACDLTGNKIYKVLLMDGDNDPVIDDDADKSVARPAYHFRFYSRPE